MLDSGKFSQIAVKNPQNQRFFIWVLFGLTKYLHDTQERTAV
jgi:hypothetical protein